jgi:hypothetical protein
MSESRNHYLHDLNDALGVPLSRRKTVARAEMAWWQSEGGATSSEDLHGAIPPGHETDWNAFNTTKVWGASHSQPGNSVPVQVYANRADGIAATVSTLREPRYADLMKAIMTPGVHAKTICKRIVESDWGTVEHPMYDVLDDIVKRGLYDSYNLRVYPS